MLIHLLPRFYCTVSTSTWLDLTTTDTNIPSDEEDLFAGTEPFDKLGSAIALNKAGTVLVVGAPNGGFERRGHVIVYEMVNNNDSSTLTDGASISWQRRGPELVGQDTGDEFGASVATNGDGTIVVIGAPFHGDNNSGQVRVYQYRNGLWKLLGFPMEPNHNDDDSPNILGFGASVALNDPGTILAVGSQASENAEAAMGFVQIFALDDDDKTWKLLGNILRGHAPGDGFGSTIALNINGGTVVVGAHGRINTESEDVGHVYMYYYNGAYHRWDPLGQLDGLRPGDAFGSAVDISYNGRIVAIGSAAAGEETGLARVYQYNGHTGIWERVGQTLQGEAVGSQFGFSIALSTNGKVVAVGAHNHNQKVGQVQVFTYNPASVQWEPLGSAVTGTSVGDNMGVAVALSGNGKTLATGVLVDNDAGKDAGRVHVWKYIP